MTRIGLTMLALWLGAAGAATAQQPGWGTQPAQPGWGAQPAPPAWAPEQLPAPPSGLPPPPPGEPAFAGQQAQAGPDAFANIGLGLSTHFAPLFLNSATLLVYPASVEGDLPPAGETVAWMGPAATYANLSFRYRMNEAHEFEANLGLAYIGPKWNPDGDVEEDVEGDGFLFQIVPRYLFTFASTERTRIYTGAGIGIFYGLAGGDPATDTHDERNVDVFGFNFGVPLGIEYRFESAPNLGLTMELGLAIAYAFVSEEIKPMTGVPDATPVENKWSMFLFGMGQAMSILDEIHLPIIDHLTFGLHYWFG